MLFTRQKALSPRELNAYRLLDYLGLTHISMPHKVEASTLHMATGQHPSRLDLDVVRLYYQVLAPMYQHRSHSPSPGVYAFMGNGVMSPKAHFLHHLLHEVEQVASQVPDRCKTAVYQESFASFSYACRAFERQYQPYYHLLHGDLFLGNILLYQEEFRLIDFEYLRFGPRELELAFLLCWDFISNEALLPYATFVIDRNLSSLVASDCLSAFQAKLIRACLIPMYVCLAQLNASAGIYSDCAMVLRTSLAFWAKYRDALLHTPIYKGEFHGHL